MRKTILLLLFTGAACASFCQGRNLYASATLLPKTGQTKALENAIKSHTQKFHGTDRMRVYQFVSGPTEGKYQLVQGPYSWSALDSLKLGDVHDADWDGNISTKTDEVTGTSYSRLRPELSYGSQDMAIEKSTVTYLNIRRGRLDSALHAVKMLREVMVLNNDKRNMTVYTKMLAGTAPQIILVYRHKNGWVDMEEGFYGVFRTMMSKPGSPITWEEFNRLNDANIESQQVAMRVFRKDLSSQ